MGLWKKSNERLPEVERSAKICEERDALMLKFPGIMKEWNAADKPVLEAAKELSVISLTENPEKIVDAKQVLRLAIWARDGIKSDFQRKLDELNGQIEELNVGTINEKCQEWRESLMQLRDKKIIEKVKTRQTVDAGDMITYKSNFGTITAAKEQLILAISNLRSMRQSPLGEVHSFIKKTESSLSGVDFSALKEEPEVTEQTFSELCLSPEVTIYTTAQLLPGPPPGQYRIVKNYDLPVREMK